MDNETQTKKPEGQFIGFLKQFSWAIAAGCGVIAILALLGTIVTAKLEDGTKLEIHLWDYFGSGYAYNWSMYITLGLLVAAIACAALHKINENFDVASAMLFLLALTMLVLAREFFSYNDGFKSVKVGWADALSMVFAAVGFAFAISASVSKKPFTVRDLAEDGVLIAAAFVLNFIKLPIATGGGSINFQMLPLFLIALRRGPAHGLICGGLVYGLITCLTDGYGFATYPFDYLIGFGSVMVLGFLRSFIFGEGQKSYNLKGEIFLLVGGILATLIRFIGSTASSMIVYGVDFVGALTYNAIYIPVSGAIALAVIMAAYGPLANINARFPAQGR